MDRHPLERALAGFESLGPWPESEAVGLACSGGADSTFLALAWKEFRPESWERCQIFVVDHGHRAGSAEDAARARELYQELGFRVALLSAGEESSMNASHGTPSKAGFGLRAEAAPNEAELRRLRYGLLQAAAEARAMQVLCTAHHADDQAETVMLRILRGTGLRGLAGIPARRTLGTDGLQLLRPLLDLRRQEMQQSLREWGRSWIEDPTNDELEVAARNRLRKLLWPELEALATGDPTIALLKLAQEAGEWRAAVEDWLERSPAAWVEWPSYLRRQAVAARLRELGETVSPARLRDLEGALMRHDRAGVKAGVRLQLRGGRIEIERD